MATALAVMLRVASTISYLLLSSALARPRAIYPVAARVVEDTLALVVALDKLLRHQRLRSRGQHNDFVNEE